MDQIILACDDNGKFLEYIPKMIGHTGKGRRHLAITVLIYNKRGEVLIQRRKHQVFNNIWDLTGATHPLHKDKNETLKEATLRCLKDEYGIKEKISLKNLGFFNYFAKAGNLCENEHCAMMIGQYNGDLNLNKDKGYEFKWIKKAKLLKDIEDNPKKYTAWANEGLKILKKSGFFD